jgi:hypothetical protein
MGEIINAHRILVEKPGGKISRNLDVGGRIILKRIVREIGLEGVDWIDVAQDRDRLWALVNTVMNFEVP